MSSYGLSPTTHDEGIAIYDAAMERVKSLNGLLRRAVVDSELPLSELAPQVMSVIQQRVVASVPADPLYETMANDTPGVGDMAWPLWGVVDELAREDERHHDALIAFINAFFPLLRAQPWTLWDCPMRTSHFCLGPVFREAIWFELSEQGIQGWINFCRFVARMTRDTEHDFSLFLLWFARDALEDCKWVPASDPDASVLAFEGVIDVCGVRMVRSDEDYGRSGSGGDGVRKWEGKTGFCPERWLFWESGLENIARDEARPVHVRDSAQRTATKMQSIRARFETENKTSTPKP